MSAFQNMYNLRETNGLANEPPCEKPNNLSFRPGPEVIKLFSCSTRLSNKFKLLINAEIVEKCRKFRLKTEKKLVIYPAELSMKKKITSG